MNRAEIDNLFYDEYFTNRINNIVSNRVIPTVLKVGAGIGGFLSFLITILYLTLTNSINNYSDKVEKFDEAVQQLTKEVIEIKTFVKTIYDPNINQFIINNKPRK